MGTDLRTNAGKALARASRNVPSTRIKVRAAPKPAPRVVYQHQAREPLPPSYGPKVARQVARAQQQRAPLLHHAREPLPQSYNPAVALAVLRAQRAAAKTVPRDQPIVHAPPAGPVGTPGGPKAYKGGWNISGGLGKIAQGIASYQSAKDQANFNPDPISRAASDAALHPVKTFEHYSRARTEAQAGNTKALERSGLVAPAVKVLDLAATPNHLISREASKVLTGKDPGSKATMSDVLQNLGVHNKVLKAVVGTGLDVATDPTTYVTFGTGAAKDALAVDRGVQAGAKVRIPFKEKPVVEAKTSGRATSAVARTVKKAPGVKRTGAKVRDVLHETVAPDVTPSFRTRAEHQAIRDAERRTRAKIAAGERQTARKVQAFKRAAPKAKQQEQVVKGLEQGTAHQLPEPLRLVARAYKREHTRQFVAKRDRGLLAAPFKPEGPADAQAYFPHVNKKVLDEKGHPQFSGGSRPARERGRKIRLTLHDANAEAPGLFIEQPHAAFGVKAAQVTRQTARADLWKSVVDAGRPFGKDAHLPDLQHEGVYEVTPYGPREVKRADGYPDLHKLGKIADGETDGRYVVLNRRSVEAVQARANQSAKTAPGRLFDRTQGKLKLASTMLNPGFQPRNLIGDSILGWMADTSGRSFAQSLRATRAMHARNVFESSPEAVTKAGPKAAKAQRLLSREIKLGNETSTYGRELQLAEQHGAINNGFAGAELRNQIGGLKVKTNKLIRRGQVKVKGEGVVSKVNSTRENLPRFATYLSARKRGLSPDEAARHSLKSHIDYADLTTAERNFARRALPFYTFFARNTRIQATTLLTRPGKVATVAHILDEAAKTAGYQGGYEQYVTSLPESQQRGLPVPVHIGGNTYPVFVSPPQTDLNQLSSNASEQWQNVANRITFFKTLPEVLANYSIFFQGQIQNPKAPRVPAPAGVEHLPGPVRRLLGVAKILDKKSGKMVWGWYAKADYVSRTLPQSNFGVSVLKPVQDNRGLDGPLAIASFLTGIRVGPDKAGDNRIGATYQQLTKVQNRLGELRQEGVSKDHPNAEYLRLLAEQKQLSQQAYALKQQRGDKVLPGVGGPSGGAGGTYGAPSGGSGLYGAPTGGSSLYGVPEGKSLTAPISEIKAENALQNEPKFVDAAVKKVGQDNLLKAAGRSALAASAPTFNAEGPAHYAAAFQRNRQYAKPGPYQTKLSPAQETSFRQWVATRRVPFDPNAKTVDYDMRGFWKSTGGKWTSGHFPDTFKTPYDTTFSRESKYASRDNPLTWQGNTLVNTRTKQVVFAPPPGAGPLPKQKPIVKIRLAAHNRTGNVIDQGGAQAMGALGAKALGPPKRGPRPATPKHLQQLAKALKAQGANTGQIDAVLSGRHPIKALIAHLQVPSGVPKGEWAQAVAKFGHIADKEAAKFGLTGPELVAKIIKGESGFNMNAVSSAGARAGGQFMPADRQQAIKQWGVDPWRSPAEAVHAVALRMGKGTGLAGYNPGGGRQYINYILGQPVGGRPGVAPAFTPSSSAASSAPTSPGVVASAPASGGTPSGGRVKLKGGGPKKKGTPATRPDLSLLLALLSRQSGATTSLDPLRQAKRQAADSGSLLTAIRAANLV